MRRREILGVAGLGLASAAMFGKQATAQHPHHHDKYHGECLKACETCATVCNETFHHCFEKVKDGHAEHHATAVLTIDCQEFCGLTSELMARESPMISIACLACADACKTVRGRVFQARRPADEGVCRRVQGVRDGLPQWPRRLAKVPPRPKAQASKPVAACPPDSSAHGPRWPAAMRAHGVKTFCRGVVQKREPPKVSSI